MQDREKMIAEIASEVVARLRLHLPQPLPPAREVRSKQDGGQDGVFDTVDDAVNAAHAAQKKKRVAPEPDRGVHIRAARPYSQPVRGFFGQHRRMQIVQN